MKNKSLFGILAVLVILSLILAACAPSVEPTEVVAEPAEPVATEAPAEAPAQEPTQAPAEEPAQPPAEKKIVNFAWTQEPDSLNNPFYSDMLFTAYLHQVFLCWAWEFDDQNLPFPRLVTEIPSLENGGVSEDGKTITMHLRDDIVWSDGTPITSADFKFTYDMAMDPANTVFSQYPLDMLESLETPDELTVIMKFPEPFAPWLATFWHGIMPKHILQPVFDEVGSIAEADWNNAPTVGCGPFNFAEWESGSYIRFERNENYFDGQAKLDEIYFLFVPDDATQTAKMIAGETNMGYWPPFSDIPSLEEAGLKIMTQSNGYAEGIFFNFREMASPAALDLTVRQAVAMAIDRQAIIDDLLLGLTQPAETFWDGMAAYGYVPDDIQSWEYNPDEARRILEEAGWVDTDGDGIREKDGDVLHLIHGTTIKDIRQDIQVVLQQQLAEVGIELELLSQDSDIFFGSYTDGAPPAAGTVDLMEWSDAPFFPDPDTDYWLCSQMPNDENPWGYNYYGCDEELDALFQEQATTVDSAKRTELIQQIARIVHDKVYWIGLYIDPDYWIVGPTLRNIKFSGVTPFYNIVDWDLE